MLHSPTQLQGSCNLLSDLKARVPKPAVVCVTEPLIQLNTSARNTEEMFE